MAIGASRVLMIELNKIIEFNIMFATANYGGDLSNGSCRCSVLLLLQRYAEVASPCVDVHYIKYNLPNIIA